MVSILPSHFYNGVFPGLFDQCISVEHPRSEMNRGETTKPETHRPRLLVKPGDYVNPVPRFFSFSNMAVVGEKTLAHSELKLSLIGAFPGACTHALWLVYIRRRHIGKREEPGDEVGNWVVAVHWRTAVSRSHLFALKLSYRSHGFSVKEGSTVIRPCNH